MSHNIFFLIFVYFVLLLLKCHPHSEKSFGNVEGKNCLFVTTREHSVQKRSKENMVKVICFVGDEPTQLAKRMFVKG